MGTLETFVPREMVAFFAGTSTFCDTTSFADSTPFTLVIRRVTSRSPGVPASTHGLDPLHGIGVIYKGWLFIIGFFHLHIIHGHPINIDLHIAGYRRR